MIARASLALAAPAALAACSFGGKPPRNLVVLASTATVPAGVQRSSAAGQAITVLTPVPTAAVAGTRVPVYSNGGAVAYVKDLAWLEPPARALQRVLSETLAARTQRVVLDPRQTVADPGLQVGGTVQLFGIDAARQEAVVQFDAQRSDPGGTITVRRFEARAPVAAVTPGNAAAGLTQAANAVAVQVADWLR